MTTNTIYKEITTNYAYYDMALTSDKDFLEGLFEEVDFVNEAIECNNIIASDIKFICNKVVNNEFLATGIVDKWVNLIKTDKLYMEYYEGYIVFCAIDKVDEYDNTLNYQASLLYCPLKENAYTKENVTKYSYSGRPYTQIEYSYSEGFNMESVMDYFNKSCHRLGLEHPATISIGHYIDMVRNRDMTWAKASYIAETVYAQALKD